MLGGHVDDMEADWTKPIVSIRYDGQLLTFFVIFTSKHSVLPVAIYSFSLGCKCIFLLGGKTRDEVPTAMFLRSGDIVLMAGKARECFHGILLYEMKVICK